MQQRELTIRNKLGLHARAAAKFVQCATRFDADVQVGKDAMTVNGKSIIGVLLLAAPKGTQIQVIAEGDDEEEAIEALSRLVEEKFGEE